MITNKFKKKTILLLITILTCINLYSQDNYVFFGSYNWDKTTNGIYVYQLDTINGRLKKITTVKNIVNPSFLTLSPNGKYLYACTESKTPDAGSVSSFEFNPEKKILNFMNSQKSGGENPVYVTVHQNGKWLINGNYTEGSVSVYPIAEDGKIEPFTQNFQYTEGSIDPKRQDRSHIHSTIFSPNYDFIFFPDLGADKIRCYQFDSNQRQPLQTSEKPFEKSPLGSGPRHFTFHPTGKFGYCIEELSGTISAYKYENGKLDTFQRINTHPETLKSGFESSDIHISPDGKFLYASNRGQENNIAIFSIAEDGILKNIGYQSTLGEHPRVFALNPSGSFLIATNTGNGNVIVFKRDKETGLLKKVGKKITIRNVSCVQIKQY